MKIFAANWKMNQAPADAAAFMRTFIDRHTRRQDRRVLFFPSALSVHVVVNAVQERLDLEVGVQNIHWEDKGAFTGETSGALARAAGARHALVGHSERRHLFGETDDETGLKVAAAVRSGLTPMICVGETLEQREAGETLAVVKRQLAAAVARIEPSVVATSMVAYEPVWAIGTGKTATPEDAAEVHVALRAELRGICGERGAAVPILYGGSVNRTNVQALLSAPEVDGVLVGGASLDAEQWLAIVRSSPTEQL
ncbi:MAG TPA: triose-phosphate isomerase [Gemmatimonadaceae bacterium]|nr:triose-phosphate isomerase [Gemmatimonadaceae bacterium]